MSKKPKDITPDRIRLYSKKEKLERGLSPEEMAQVFGGWTVGTDEMSKGSVKLKSTEERISIGSGNKVMKFDGDYGLWLGNAVFADAPFQVDMDGNVTAESVNQGQLRRVVDDISNLQDAIDAVNSNGGGTVVLESGTYTLSSNINLKSNVALVGVDADNTIIDCNNTSNHITVTGSVSTHIRNVDIKQLKVINWDGASSGGIKMEYCDDSRLERCIFDSNVSTTSVFGDVVIDNSTNVAIDQNRFLKNSDCSLLIGSSSFIAITNNRFEEDIYATDISAKCIISSNFFTEDSEIFFEVNVTDALIVNNRFQDNGGSAVNMGNGCERITIANNHIYHTNYDFNTGVGAISVSGGSTNPSTNIIIRGNLINDANDDGIELYGYIDNCIVSGNIVINCGDYGIIVSSSNADNNIITSNQVLNNSTGQISDSGTGTVKANNVTS